MDKQRFLAWLCAASLMIGMLAVLVLLHGCSGALPAAPAPGSALLRGEEEEKAANCLP